MPDHESSQRWTSRSSGAFSRTSTAARAARRRRPRASVTDSAPDGVGEDESVVGVRPRRVKAADQARTRVLHRVPVAAALQLQLHVLEARPSPLPRGPDGSDPLAARDDIAGPDRDLREVAVDGPEAVRLVVDHDDEPAQVAVVVTPASVRSPQWLTRRCCEADSDRQNRQNLNDFLQRQATDMESHDAPSTIPGDDRLYPNPAELLAAVERLPHDAGLSHAARPSVS
jgi:hypothetical protein